jgi:hypothetical protein
MDRIVSLLLFAVLFYFLMRFGCGSHAVHGHYQGRAPRSHRASREGPVCGMGVAGSGLAEGALAQAKAIQEPITKGDNPSRTT